jgi:hypothetical protein
LSHFVFTRGDFGDFRDLFEGVRPPGFEPGTFSLRGSSSTN